MGPTHSLGGVNYADVWHTALQVIGWMLVVTGVTAMAWSIGLFYRKKTTAKFVIIPEP